MFNPYTDEELEFHEKDRILKSNMEIIHAENFKLLTALKRWDRYFEKGEAKPKTRFRDTFMPTSVGRYNTYDLFADICEYVAIYEHGSVPEIPIVAFACKSTITLLDRLQLFNPTEYVKTAYAHFRKFMELIAYEGKPRYKSADEFRKALWSEAEAFLEAASNNVQELNEYVIKHEKGDKPVKVALTTPVETKLNEADKKELVKPVKTVEKKVDDIYTTSVEYKEVATSRIAGNIRKKMAQEGSEKYVPKSVSAKKIALDIIVKYDGRTGAYTKDEVDSLAREIRRLYSKNH